MKFYVDCKNITPPLLSTSTHEQWLRCDLRSTGSLLLHTKKIPKLNAVARGMFGCHFDSKMQRGGAGRRRRRLTRAYVGGERDCSPPLRQMGVRIADLPASTGGDTVNTASQRAGSGCRPWIQCVDSLEAFLFQKKRRG